MARVICVQICEKKGSPAIRRDKIRLEEGLGIEGDRHVAFEGRDVCILRREVLDWERDQDEEGFCFHKHKPNLIIEGLGQEEVVPGATLCFPDALLRVSDLPKHCFPDLCGWAKEGRDCMLRGEYQMCSIVRSGTIAEGDEVTVCSPSD